MPIQNPLYTSPEIHQKFLNGLSIADNGCWNWTGKLINGYGFFSQKGMTFPSHRYSWGYKNGFEKLIHGMCICHKCNNKACVNPDHLYQGTHQDNSNDRRKDDMIARGSRNGKSKLTEQAVKYIRENARIGDIPSQARCMIKFNVSQTTIQSVLNRMYWKESS